MSREFYNRLTIAQGTVNGVKYRRFVYQEIYDQNTSICFSYVNSTFKDNSKSQIEDVPVEPMEVDTSANDSCDTFKEIPHLNVNQKLNSSRKLFRQKICCVSHLNVFTSLIFLIIGAATLFMCMKISCILGNSPLQSHYIQSDLEANLLNQSEAILTISYNIDAMDVLGTSRILTFIGPTGVGKTFTANILKRHFNPNYIFEINFIEEGTKIINDLSACYCNLVLIDNLKVQDLKNLTEFLNLLPLDNFRLFVILIFNVHETADGLIYNVNINDYELIQETINELNVDNEWVIFCEPDFVVVEKWLRTKLEERGIDKIRHDGLISSMLDIGYVKRNGFKGLEQKISLIN